MRPLTLVERGVGSPTVSLGRLLQGGRPAISGRTDVDLERYVQEILMSGFPGIHNLPERLARAQLDATQPYRDVLERLWILDPLEAWLPTRNRLAVSPRPRSTISPIQRSQRREVDLIVEQR